MKKNYFIYSLLIVMMFFLTACGSDETYEIKWVVEGITVEVDSEVVEDTLPEYNGTTPIKVETAAATYTFKGWSPAVSKATKDQTYTAMFTEVKKTFKISFYDENGDLLKDDILEYGSTPVYNYSKEDTIEYKYIVEGWSTSKGGTELGEIPLVTGNASYYAIVKQVTQNYTITFDSNGGSPVSSITDEYGVEILEPTEPISDGYNFVTWCTDEELTTPVEWPITLVGNTTLYACWKQIYTITFDSNGGSPVASINNEYGVVIPEPTKPILDGYLFVSWCTDEELTTPVEWPITLVENITLYACWNEKVSITEYLNSLLEGFELNPYSYIPETMRYDYASNLINSTDGVYDFTTNVNVSDIKYGGFGEQWNMVATNINQSNIFFNVLSVVEGLSVSITTAFNNYLDKNPANTANYTFEEGIYTVTIKYEDNIISLQLDYTATFPVIGEQTAQIYLDYNIETLEKICRIQLGDANALKYEVSENSYKFAIRYSGIRRAYFEVSKDELGNTEGSIFEFTGIDGKVSISSAAQFLITEDYVSVVGNKAGGMLGFTGYINELYSTKAGKLLGYEVREELSKIVYNTMWFNLDDISGITSIKQETVDEVINTYLNGLSDAFKTKKVGGLGFKMASRRFDIELRTQYFYYYDSTNDKYVEVASEVPMLFVQEEFLTSFSDDINSVNPNITASITLNNDVLEKVRADHHSMIDIFIANKENVTAETILNYISEKNN